MKTYGNSGIIIVFLGVPGSGKGTQAKRLSSSAGLPYIGTGDILRINVEKKTPLGLKVSEILRSGKLVDDETMIELIKQEIKDKKSFILDGFPRTVAQADAVEKLLSEFGTKVNCVLFLDVADDEVIKRIMGRFFCSNCRKEFNLYLDKIEDKICPVCGGELSRRSDDTEETIKNRILEYREKTAPLIDYYEARGVLTRVNGSGGVDEIFFRIREALNNKIKGSAAN